MIPEGTVRSAIETPPLPKSSSSVPTIAASRQCARVGLGPPPARTIAYRIAPAMTNRTPA
ncbi:MAG: hypothetical protein AUH85_14885 [Chloroflexi bacterium 13_1_40CM_4_68_4]|nr:MAG: hypothetical protein AUH85_14885 [Chloroflexi bacterium 13_1_40CM_4_68_4]